MFFGIKCVSKKLLCVPAQIRFTHSDKWSGECGGGVIKHEPYHYRYICPSIGLTTMIQGHVLSVLKRVLISSCLRRYLCTTMLSCFLFLLSKKTKNCIKAIMSLCLFDLYLELMRAQWGYLSTMSYILLNEVLHCCVTRLRTQVLSEWYRIQNEH